MLLGDCNTNVLMPSSNNSRDNAFHNSECVFGFKHLITDPTSESAIYFILVTDYENMCQSGVLNDHLITYCTKTVNITHVTKRNIFRMRCLMQQRSVRTKSR